MFHYLKSKYKRIQLKRKIDRVSQNSKIPFYLAVYTKSLPRIEVVRQFQLKGADISLTDEYGFAIYLIVSYSKKHKKNLEGTPFFDELIDVDLQGGKYLLLRKNNFGDFKNLLYMLKKDVFELKEGESFEMSMKLF